MNEQKGLFTRLGETLDQYRTERHTVVQEPAPTGRRGWLHWLGRQMVPNIGTLLMVVVLLLTIPSLAAPLIAPSAPSACLISYQGRLADAEGNPITGKVNIEFRLYDVPTGGVPLWEEFWTGGNAVDVSDGLFSVMLGSINDTLCSAIEGRDELYLGITVGTDSEMEPRVQLGSVPFAMVAETANRLLSLHAYRFWRGDDKVIHYYGPSGTEVTLDLGECSGEGWCCNATNDICYYQHSGQDSILEFSLEGSPSITCALFHQDDDIPSSSKGLYFATDGGNHCHMGKACARLSREGIQDSPINIWTTYYWLCPEVPSYVTRAAEDAGH